MTNTERQLMRDILNMQYSDKEELTAFQMGVNCGIMKCLRKLEEYFRGGKDDH